MVYNTQQKQLLLFGGWNGESRMNETWSYENNEWMQLNPNNSPTARNHSYMIYDEKHKKAILFGGHDGQNVFGDMWEFSNSQWKYWILSQLREYKMDIKLCIVLAIGCTVHELENNKKK